MVLKLSNKCRLYDSKMIYTKFVWRALWFFFLDAVMCKRYWMRKSECSWYRNSNTPNFIHLAGSVSSFNDVTKWNYVPHKVFRQCVILLLSRKKAPLKSHFLRQSSLSWVRTLHSFSVHFLHFWLFSMTNG